MRETTIETERMILRMFRESDFAEYAEICADPEITRFTFGKPLKKWEAWRHMAYLIGHWELRGHGYFAAEEKATGRLIGRIGFTDMATWPGFELGWTIATEFQGRGLATEGARRLLRYAFEELDKPHVISLVHPDNIASRRVAEKLGEKIEGEADLFDFPALIYGIDRPSD